MLMIEVENVNHPGRTSRVDAIKFNAIKAVRVMPTEGPGYTQSEMIATVKAAAPQDLFPGGATSGWWTKSVQLDMEAKGELTRIPGKPTRWRLPA